MGEKISKNSYVLARFTLLSLNVKFAILIPIIT